jgi:hypothetical protein
MKKNNNACFEGHGIMYRKYLPQDESSYHHQDIVQSKFQEQMRLPNHQNIICNLEDAPLCDLIMG